MATPDALDALLVDRGRLKAVLDIDLSLPGGVLAFEFETGTTIAWVNSSDAAELADMAVAGRDDPSMKRPLELLGSGDTNDVIGLTEQSPWSQLVGNYVAWAWTLTNHQGFEDGVQMEFVETSTMTSTILQRWPKVGASASDSSTHRLAARFGAVYATRSGRSVRPSATEPGRAAR